MTTLDTPRLRLRPFLPSDFDALHGILSDPLTMSFWPAPFTQDGTRRWMKRNAEHWQAHGFGRWAVMLKETEELIGDCGLAVSEIHGQRENDLGYILHHPVWGHGYATEAASACQAYAHDTLRLPRLVANMPADHAASRRVAEKIGMHLECRFNNPRNRDILTCLYATASNG